MRTLRSACYNSSICLKHTLTSIYMTDVFKIYMNKTLKKLSGSRNKFLSFCSTAGLHQSSPGRCRQLGQVVEVIQISVVQWPPPGEAPKCAARLWPNLPVTGAGQLPLLPGGALSAGTGQSAPQRRVQLPPRLYWPLQSLKLKPFLLLSFRLILMR